MSPSFLNTGSSWGSLWGQSLPISGSSVRPCTLTPHFHKVWGCCSGSSATPGHPHTELHRRLVDTSSIRADRGSASRWHSRSHERVGVKTKHQEKCAFSITEVNLSGRGVGFDHDAGTTVSFSDRVDPHCSRESQRRPDSDTHCQVLSKTAGSNGSCIQRDTFWRAVHETPTVVAQDQGLFPVSRGTSIAWKCWPCFEHWNTSFQTWEAIMCWCAPTTQLWSLISTTREVCVRAPCTGWRTRSLCGPKGNSFHWEQFMPGHLNQGADILSRQGPRPVEWRLHPDVVCQIWRMFGQAQVDLFAT